MKELDFQYWIGDKTLEEVFFRQTHVHYWRLSHGNTDRMAKVVWILTEVAVLMRNNHLGDDCCAEIVEAKCGEFLISVCSA
jgi:hypothetical protein